MGQTSVKVNMPVSAEQVWQTVEDFGGIDRWIPGIASLTMSGSGVGAKRTVTYEDGTRSVERLESRNDASRTLTYAVLESTLPVEGYVASLTVRDLPVGCEVEWYSTFGAKGAAENEVSRMLEGNCRKALTGLQKFLRS
jgi:hypothetical protein